MSANQIRSHLILEIHDQFEALSDYIWKTPNFIASEIEVERRKLREYFPGSTDPETDRRANELRKFRAALEGAKLFVHFPRYLAMSNLFLATSIFEHFLYAICRETDAATPYSTVKLETNGITSCFRYLRKLGHDPSDSDVYQQVQAATTIRNTLLHADGLIEFSRNPAKVQSIVSQMEYRPVNTRQSLQFEPEVSIGGEPSRLSITNTYAHNCAFYFKQLLLWAADSTL